ncbi:MAG TPA: amino acid adenylation domain-containing protein, partial [Candidatus Deferrimicrobium sp.]|nr:amino acid adenylation domain-containing protein [Candidatus Deferrimicrobium sp.]
MRDYTLEKTVLQSFAEQVNKVGDRTAVIGMGQRAGKDILHLTYRELHEKSNGLAYLLHNKGVGPDSIVGIMMNRSIEMVICLLGIWKAGGAYLPIEPDLPQERIDYMLKESNAKIVINDQNNLDFEYIPDFEFGTRHLLSANVAYLIYTSGSTGRPKGVLVEHRNLAAYLNAFTQRFKFNLDDIVLQQASYAFDTFVEEVYGALLCGSAIAIADNRTVRDIDLLLEFIEKYNITVLDCVPLLLNELNKRCATRLERRRVRTVHTFISGGDVLKYRHIDHLLKSGKVYNTYGPTETTVCATHYRCPAKRYQLHLTVPIGKPVAGYTVYIVDPTGKPAPTGVVGELCIAGPGVTRGYLNQPELTAEKYGPQITLFTQITRVKKTKIN